MSSHYTIIHESDANPGVLRAIGEFASEREAAEWLTRFAQAQDKDRFIRARNATGAQLQVHDSRTGALHQFTVTALQTRFEFIINWNHENRILSALRQSHQPSPTVRRTE